MLGLLPDKSRTHKMLGQKRKICDMSDELDASEAAVESIIRRIQCVNDRSITISSQGSCGSLPLNPISKLEGLLHLLYLQLMVIFLMCPPSSLWKSYGHVEGELTA